MALFFISSIKAVVSQIIEEKKTRVMFYKTAIRVTYLHYVWVVDDDRLTMLQTCNECDIVGIPPHPNNPK